MFRLLREIPDGNESRIKLWDLKMKRLCCLLWPHYENIDDNLNGLSDLKCIS